jgi:hypothetical protein
LGIACKRCSLELAILIEVQSSEPLFKNCQKNESP